MSAAVHRKGHPPVFVIRLRSTSITATSVLLRDDSGVLTATDEEIAAYARATVGEPVAVLPRPLRTPAKVLLVSVRDGWRPAGARAARAVTGDEELQVVLPPAVPAEAVRAFAEGLWLGGYRY